jgi:cyclic-di-GMP phosphodiesterase TipF (flagellum assembly factor)
MLRFSAIFIAACMVLISASFAAVLYLILALPIVGALLCGIAALSGLALCTIVASALRGANPSSGRIVDLSRGVADLARQVAELGRRVAVMDGKVESAVEQTDTSPLTAELDEIGVLIRQLAEQVSAHDVALLARHAAPARAVGATIAPAPSFAFPLALEGRAGATMAPSVPVPAPLQLQDLADRAPPPASAARLQSSLPDRTPAAAPAPARGDAASANDGGAAALAGALKAPSGFVELDTEAQKRMLREAVEANRLEFYLQPILALPQRKPRHYEALARLRTGDGELLAAADFLPAATACGLMPRIDNLMLFRCVQVVRRLTTKNRDVGLICNIAAATLSDAEYFPQFVEFMDANRALAPALAFEFTQAACRAFGPKENEGLGTLMGLGFRFSMDNVGDLKFEPRDLADRGFRFIKVPATLLLGHVAGASAGDIHPADLTGLLSRFGIEMIVEMIEDEATVLDLLDLDVRYGQGHLFSPPRPVRADVLQTSTERSDEAASAEAAPQALQGAVPQARKADGGAPAPAGVTVSATVSSLPDRRLEALQRPTALAQIARTVAARVAQGSPPLEGEVGRASGRVG